MQLRPNPPRLVTVGVALLLGVVGFAVVWPVAQLAPVLEPVNNVLATVGLTLDRDLGYLFLFACPSLLVAGSLLPGI